MWKQSAEHNEPGSWPIFCQLTTFSNKRLVARARPWSQHSDDVMWPIMSLSIVAGASDGYSDSNGYSQEDGQTTCMYSEEDRPAMD